jgi:hypothetical protein
MLVLAHALVLSFVVPITVFSPRFMLLLWLLLIATPHGLVGVADATGGGFSLYVGEETGNSVKVLVQNYPTAAPTEAPTTHREL